MQKSEQKQLIISVRTKNIRQNNQSLAGVKYQIDEIKRAVCTTYSYSSNEIVAISQDSLSSPGAEAVMQQLVSHQLSRVRPTQTRDSI